MAKIVAVANQKGGVGKTTSAVNLAAAVGKLGKKVLLIDADPQGNATSGFGIDKRNVALSTYDMLMSPSQAKDCIVKTAFKNVDVIPSSISLAGAELELVNEDRRETRFTAAAAILCEGYDFIFIDCPPSLGLITLNSLCAADSIIVPIQCEFYALEGLSQLMATVRQVKRLYNPSLDIEGVLLTMFDGRLNLTQQVVGEVKKFFPQKVYKSFIPRTVRLSEAPSFGEPIIYYDPKGKGSESYISLAKEFLKANR
ncbi:MAG: ParA family protein [Clostridia bacterium]|nr:ParA family protein [Clostridia bacterium]